jgi:predicted alpha/beta superfamily hydrolase
MSGRYPLVTLPDTEMRVLASSQTGQEYRISVAFPDNYGQSDRTYIPCYLLDSQYLFGMATEYSRLLAMDDAFPGLIIVGIGFPVPRSDVQPYRKWNYIPSGWNDESGNGGAEDFLRFMREDLIPVVETEHRVDPSDRWLFGDSRGGLFVLYALLQEEQTFTRYMIGSPWFTQDEPETVFRHEDGHAATHADLEASVLMSAGSLEPDPVVENMRKLFLRLRGRQYRSLKLMMRIFQGETHLSVAPHNLSYGLTAATN